MSLRDLVRVATDFIWANHELMRLVGDSDTLARLDTPTFRTTADSETGFSRLYADYTSSLLLFPDVDGSNILTVVDVDATDRVVIAAGGVLTVDGAAGDDLIILRNGALVVTDE